MYKVTQKVLDLVEDLFKQGYQGEATLTTSYASGTRNVLGDTLSVQLSGFCKETLHLVEDLDDPDNDVFCVGRYGEEGYADSVERIVGLAWSMYKAYKQSGYSMPHEFEELFKKYGYLKQKVVPAKTVWEEQ